MSPAYIKLIPSGTEASDGLKRVIGHLLTNPSFAAQIQQNAESTLGPYNLKPAEKAVLSRVDAGALQRIQVSTTAQNTLCICIPYRP
jgi:hypothetical protein